MPLYTGEEAVEKARSEHERVEKERAQRKADENDPLSEWRQWWKRYFMKATPHGADGNYVTFLDGLENPAGFRMPVLFAEHQKWDGVKKKMSYITCIEGDPHPTTGKPMSCEACKDTEKYGRAILIAPYAIIDHREYEDREGNTKKDQIRLLAAKSILQAKLQKKSNKLGGLRGWRVEVIRSSSDVANTGDEYNFEDKVDLPDDLQPPNWKAIFAPKTEEQLKDQLSGKEETKPDKTTGGSVPVGEDKPIAY